MTGDVRYLPDTTAGIASNGTATKMMSERIEPLNDSHQGLADDIAYCAAQDDRLTRICAAMTTAFDAHPEKLDGDKCIVFLDSDPEQRSGLTIHGYTDEVEAMANLFMHLRAMFRSTGRDLEFIGIPDTPGDLT